MGEHSRPSPFVRHGSQPRFVSHASPPIRQPTPTYPWKSLLAHELAHQPIRPSPLPSNTTHVDIVHAAGVSRIAHTSATPLYTLRALASDF